LSASDGFAFSFCIATVGLTLETFFWGGFLF